MKSLVLHPTFGLFERNDVPLCSSRQVAELFEKEHKHVLDAVRQAITETQSFAADFSATNFLKSSFLDRGKSYPEFLLTKDGASYVGMKFTGQRAAQFRVALLQRFNQYEAYLRAYILARAEFEPFTRAVQDAHEEPKSYHYSNEVNMINRIVLGMDAKHFKLTHDIPVEVTSIRPYLSPVQSKAIRKLQIEDIRLLYKGFPYQERKQALTGFFSNLALGGCNG